MIKAYFSLALKNLRRRGIRSILTMLGIFIGIAAVVALISLGQGLKEAVTGQFSSLDVDKLIMQNAGTGFGPPGSTSVQKLTEHDIDVIKSVNGVQEAIPRLLRMASFEYNSITRYEYIASIPEDEDKMKIILDSLNLEMFEGRFLSAEDTGKIVLGYGFAKERYGKKISVGSKVSIQGKNFEVIGILKEAGNFQLNNAVLMIEGDMKDIFGLQDEIDLIVVQLEKGSDSAEIAEKIKQRIRKDRNEKIGEEDFSVQTPLQAIGAITTILNIINIIVIGIACISLIVGGVGIANTMYTSVLERTREIGVMKSIGAENKDVLAIFLIESGLLGLVGGIIGVLMGLGMAFGVASAANSAFGSRILVVQISWPLIIGAINFSFFMGLFFGILPALSASRLKPVEALRK